jgi:twinkle protein
LEYPISVCVEKIKCEDCGSSDGKQVYFNDKTDTYSSFCWAGCNEYKGDPYEGKEAPDPPVPKTPEQIFKEIQEIRELPTFDLEHRGLPGNTFRSWGLRMGLSQQDGKTPAIVFFPYTNELKLKGWKARTLQKRVMWSVGCTKNSDPFGYTRALKVGGKRLYITEGEYDAIALNYALERFQSGTKYEGRRFAVISLPAGAGSMAGMLNKIRVRIKDSFSEIVLVMDNDAEGKKAEKVAQSLMPDVLRADMPPGCKDPNEAVQKGLSKSLATNAMWNAHKPPIRGVVQVSEVMARVLEDPVMGLSYPHDALTEMTYGQRFGECVAIGSGVGLGKTTLAHEWAAHNVMVHDEVCSMFLLEEQNHMTVRNIAGKIDSIKYHVPGIVYDHDKFMSTIEALQGKILLWESEEDQSLRFNLDEIISAIRFNHAEYGCKFASLDNMTRLVDHLPATEANEFINRYSSELENLSTQLGIHIDVYSHLNNTGKVSHERGGHVYASQFTGSRGLMRSFPMMMAFERNKHATGDLASRSYLGVIKNRKYGNEGLIKTKYTSSTGRLLEYDWDGEKLTDL